MRERMQKVLREAGEDRMVDQASGRKSEGMSPIGKSLGVVLSAAIVIALILT